MRAAPSDEGRGPATERCRPAPNNMAESSPDSLMQIKFPSRLYAAPAQRRCSLDPQIVCVALPGLRIGPDLK
jgi:hypothetical protein